MQVLMPKTLDQALEMRARHPGSVPVAGGTDVMVDLNFDRLRPDVLMDLTHVAELREIRIEGSDVFVGAGVSYTQILREMREFAPLVQASRSVGSPQIRNRATLGGNLGTASPAGDALPVLAAYDAFVVLARHGGEDRVVPWSDFLVGPKATDLGSDQIIRGVRWTRVIGPGSFSKIGTRNAMVISIASLCIQFDEEARRIRVALGSVAPTVIRAPAAEDFAAGALARVGAWDDPAVPLPPDTFREFGPLVAQAARPITDLRASADYRRHACGVLARRALAWAMEERMAGAEL